MALGPLLMMGASGFSNELLVLETFSHAAGPVNFVEGGRLAGDSWNDQGDGSWSYDGSGAGYLSSTGATNPGVGYLLVYTTPADIDIEIDVTAAPTENSKYIGIAFRYNDANNWLRLVWGRTSGGVLEWALQKNVATTITDLATGTPSDLTGTMRVLASGTSITAWLDGSEVADVTESAHSTEVKHGLTTSWTGTTGATTWRVTSLDMYSAGNRP